jgi:hypothetical protein
MAQENPAWGHRRLARLGHAMAASTVWEILHRPLPCWADSLRTSGSGRVACREPPGGN